MEVRAYGREMMRSIAQYAGSIGLPHQENPGRLGPATLTCLRYADSGIGKRAMKLQVWELVTHLASWLANHLACKTSVIAAACRFCKATRPRQAPPSSASQSPACA